MKRSISTTQPHVVIYCAERHIDWILIQVCFPVRNSKYKEFLSSTVIFFDAINLELDITLNLISHWCHGSSFFSSSLAMLLGIHYFPRCFEHLQNQWLCRESCGDGGEFRSKSAQWKEAEQVIALSSPFFISSNATWLDSLLRSLHNLVQ